MDAACMRTARMGGTDGVGLGRGVVRAALKS